MPKELNQSSKNSWEEEFDRQFTVEENYEHIGDYQKDIPYLKDFIRSIEARAREEERGKIVEIIRGFPLSDSNGVEFVFDDENWKAGYAALDTVADYIKSINK